MKKLKLRNAKVQSLTEGKVVFIGELKGWRQKLSYTISQERYKDLQQLDKNTKYNIWEIGDIYRFIPQI